MKQDVLEYLEDAYSFLMDPALGVAIDEIKRLRKGVKEIYDMHHSNMEEFDRADRTYDIVHDLVHQGKE